MVKINYITVRLFANILSAKNLDLCLINPLAHFPHQLFGVMEMVQVTTIYLLLEFCSNL